jgi:hypothetical protein
MRRLGLLTALADSDPLQQTRVAILVQALAERHWREGDNLRIDWRLTGGDPALYERYAAELVALDPDVLLAAGTPQSRRCGGKRQRSRSSSLSSPIRSGKGSSKAWRIPAATSPALPISTRRWPASGSGCWRKSHRHRRAWQSSTTPGLRLLHL